LKGARAPALAEDAIFIRTDMHLNDVYACLRNLTRPKILKTPGVVIEPLKYNKASEKDAASIPGNNAKRKRIAVVSNGMRKPSKT